MIVQHSEALTGLIFAPQLALHQPQLRQLLQVVDLIGKPRRKFMLQKASGRFPYDR